MNKEKPKYKTQTLDSYLTKKGLSVDFSTREKLFHELISPKEVYLSTRIQNIKLLSKIKRDKLSKEITDKLKSTNKSKELIGDAIITTANKYLGYPYDTSAEDDDGGGFKQWQKTGMAELRDNFTGEIYKTDKRPMVCTDLISASLEESGFISLPKKKNPYFWRRVSNIEKYAKINPKLFTVIEVNSIDGNIKKSKIGDIITYTAKDRGRHIGIVTEVDELGTPIKIINSRFDGVTEIPFLSTKSIGTDYKQKDRYDGFFTPQEGYIINYIIRIKPKKIILAKK